MSRAYDLLQRMPQIEEQSQHHPQRLREVQECTRLLEYLVRDGRSMKGNVKLSRVGDHRPGSETRMGLG